MSGSFFPPNPFLDAWMRAANTYAGAWRGALTGEWQRQQVAALEAWNRQVLGFWTGALSRPAMPRAGQPEAPRPPSPPAIAEPQLAAMAEAVPLPAAPTAEPSAPASIAPALPEPAQSPAAAAETARKPKPRGAAGLRTSVARRKGPAQKSAAPGTTEKRRPTRH